METKKCLKCLCEKDFNFFPKIGNICKECKSIYIKGYYKNNKDIIKNKVGIYYEENKEYLLAKQKENKKNKSEDISAYQKSYREKNREELKIKRKEYNDKNQDKINENRRKRYKERIKSDLNFKLKKIHRNILKRVFKYKKHKRTSELLGYTSDELKLHLESLFKENMSWDNYGEWEIDHIIPISHFDLENTPPSEVHALTNLQPLWKIENIKKSNYV